MSTRLQTCWLHQRQESLQKARLPVTGLPPLNEGRSTLQRLQPALQTHVRLLFNFTAQQWGQVTVQLTSAWEVAAREARPR